MNRQKSTRIVLFARWLARLGSLASLGLLLLFFFGEEMNFATLTPTEIWGLLFFPLGITVGMLLGWRWEIFGGSVTILSLMVFYKVMYAASGEFPDGLWFLIFALPGFLFLFCGLRSRKPQQVIKTA
ncbi:DUF7670 domain-containing protein [Candidatus Leptofilum sp.]|uniref:DUF7670 domain-containing protein n=1 Tax=Candidatus Leptofilum sp. TaxID=3241576 RepID=UPI003B5BED4C